MESSMLVLAVVCLSLNIIATQGWSARPPRQQKGPNMSSRHIAWLQTCVVTVIFIQSRIVEMGEWLGIVFWFHVCVSRQLPASGLEGTLVLITHQRKQQSRSRPS